MFRTTLFAMACALLPIAAHAADARHPVVVELYQSQGCSSCPPAIANVNALAGRPDVLALTFAVTYWDQLGWKDRFATPAQTTRQWDYARRLGHAQVWTPQVIVDGRSDVVGARPGQVEEAIAHTPARAGPDLTLSSSSVRIAAGTAPAAGADVWLVRFDPRTIAVAIRAGENAGRTILHRNVVRELVRLGTWTGAAESLPLPPADAALQTAVIVQPTGGPVIAAVRG